MVSSVYYVMFTILTITASMIMYKDWESQPAGSITFQVSGFVCLVIGIYVLTSTKDAAPGCAAGMSVVFGWTPTKAEYHLCDSHEKDDSEKDPV